jgi:hypothetical protein
MLHTCEAGTLPLEPHLQPMKDLFGVVTFELKPKRQIVAGKRISEVGGGTGGMQRVSRNKHGRVSRTEK